MKELVFPLPKQTQEEIHVEDPGAAIRMSLQIKKTLEALHEQQQLVLLCIGTDRSTGDSLGPLVGSTLAKYMPKEVKLFGTLKEPVHALNLQETEASIRAEYHRPFIIAIDACLGKLENIGLVRTKSGPLKPGAGVKKDLNPIGNMNITGVVNVSGFMEYMVLQNTRLYLVTKMAETISFALRWGINSYLN